MSIQDVLSQVKSALSSDTAKGIGKGLASAAAASLIAGPSGVSALNRGIENIRNREKERDLERVQKAKQQLYEDILREELNSKKTKNMLDLQERITSNQFGLGNNKLSSLKSSLSDKYGKISADDVAVNSKSEFKAPKIPKAAPITSTTDVGQGEDSLARGKEKARREGADYGAELVQASGGAMGKERFKEVRKKLLENLKALNLNPEQETAAWKEMTRGFMPGEYEKNQAIVNAGPDANLGAEEYFGMALPKFSGGATGMTTGALTGLSYFGIPGAIGGGIIGALSGYKMGDALTEAVDKMPQESIGNVQPIDSNLMEYGDKLIDAMNSIGITDKTKMNEINQFFAMSDIPAMPADQQIALKEYILSKLPDRKIESGGGFYSGFTGTANL